MKTRLVVAVIVTKNGKYLLGQKPKDIGPYPNTWHLLGGGINLEEETLEEAARREVKEEANIELESLEKVWFDDDYEPDKRGEKTHYAFVVFRAEYKLGRMKAHDDIHELQWFTQKQLRELPLPRTSVRLFQHLSIL